MTNILHIEKIIEPIAQRYNLEKIEIFGSYAMGTNRHDSDIDFLVKFKEEIPSIFDVCGLQDELAKILKLNVDVVTLPLVKPDKLMIEKTVKVYG